LPAADPDERRSNCRTSGGGDGGLINRFQLGLLKRFGSVHAAVAFFGVFIVSIAADKAIDKFRQCITIQSLQSKS
jgi:hypothetical protein